MSSALMKYLFKIGKTSFYWAGNKFTYQGIWIWNGKRNVRVVPFNKLSNWNGK